jgi:ATP-binding cassette subfamily G (WHITE) protein 2 (SNQ2)
MRRLAASGQTIICTIHQPSAALFEAFDILILLAKGGRTTYFGETGRDSAILLDYFARHGAPCPQDANPAEHIVDVIQGRQNDGTDWPQEWIASPEYQHMMNELHQINLDQAKSAKVTTIEDEDTADFASPIKYQISLVTKRRLIALWRNPDYIWNKIGVHVTNSLFAGFTFWKLGDGTHDLQFRMMSVFNFVFVAPGCINQLQPLFIQNRDIFESREKKSKTYHWLAFVSAQVISEIPVLVVCATLFFVCWYFSSGFPVQASASGQVYLQMIFYEFLYTSIGQAIAAYSPNAYFAALANPIIIGAFLINFCGVVVPYAQIQAFWRYWVSQTQAGSPRYLGHPANMIFCRCTTSTHSPTSSAASSSPSSTMCKSSAGQMSSHRFPCPLAQHAENTWQTSSVPTPVTSPTRKTALRASTAPTPRARIISGP